MSTSPSPADLRALAAHRDVKLYQLGAACSIHPSRLSQYLHGRIPMPAEVAERIRRALEEAPGR